MTSPRFTYFASVPFTAVAVAAFLRFEEPRLHRSAEPVALRRHVALTVRTMTRQREVLRIMLLSALAGLVSQAVFEFGPLWLVALSAPAVFFGPYWAALVSTLGLGGYLVSKLNLQRCAIVTLFAFLGPILTVTLALTRPLVAVVLARALLALLLAIIGIHAGRLLHDAVPSRIRIGVSSGVGTLSWLLFLPFSVVFGWLAREHGVQTSGWILTAAAALVGRRAPRCDPPARATTRPAGHRPAGARPIPDRRAPMSRAGRPGHRLPRRRPSAGMESRIRGAPSRM